MRDLEDVKEIGHLNKIKIEIMSMSTSSKTKMKLILMMMINHRLSESRKGL
jgi:hypothetical protein